MEGADQAFYRRPVVYERFKWLEGVAGCAAGVPTAAAAQLFYSRRGFNFQKKKLFLNGKQFSVHSDLSKSSSIPSLFPAALHIFF